MNEEHNEEQCWLANMVAISVYYTFGVMFFSTRLRLLKIKLMMRSIRWESIHFSQSDACPDVEDPLAIRCWSEAQSESILKSTIVVLQNPKVKYLLSIHKVESSPSSSQAMW